MEIDNTIEDEEEESESKAIEGAIQETNTQEISRFNNYIDAIYKRMNAALRAKLMDPMVLNLQRKDKREMFKSLQIMLRVMRKRTVIKIWMMKLSLKLKLIIELENLKQNRRETKKKRKKKGKRTRTRTKR